MRLRKRQSDKIKTLGHLLCHYSDDKRQASKRKRDDVAPSTIARLIGLSSVKQTTTAW